MSRKIFSIFAGRRENLEILFKYLEELYFNSSIDEIHIWNFTRKESDEQYINEYVKGNVIKRNQSIKFYNNMIIDNKYQICLDDNGANMVIKYGEQVMDRIPFSRDIVYHESYIMIGAYRLDILKKDAIYVKYPGWKVYDVVNKNSWAEYYNHYVHESNPNDILIKCDDDIVFIDTHQFDNFIQRRMQNQQYLLMFPNIINNGVTAYHQSQHGLIPFDMPYDTFFGKLVESGALATDIHKYFCQHINSFLSRTVAIKNIIPHKIGDRISINFFAILMKHVYVFKDVGWDDEHDVSVVIPRIYNAPIGIDMTFTVSHLGFAPQRKSGLDEPSLRIMYKQIVNDRQK